MRLHPTISFEQYRDTCLAVASVKPKVVHRRSSVEYVILAVAGLAVGLSTQSPAARLPVLVIFCTLLVCWIVSKLFVKRSQERCFKTAFAEEKELLSNQVLVIEESGIFCEMRDGQATSNYQWSAFIKRIDLPDAYVFLPSPNSFVRVPKETLMVSEQELIERWGSIVPTAGGKKA